MHFCYDFDELQPSQEREGSHPCASPATSPTNRSLAVMKPAVTHLLAEVPLLPRAVTTTHQRSAVTFLRTLPRGDQYAHQNNEGKKHVKRSTVDRCKVSSRRHGTRGHTLRYQPSSASPASEKPDVFVREINHKRDHESQGHEGAWQGTTLR